MNEKKGMILGYSGLFVAAFFVGFVVMRTWDRAWLPVKVMEVGAKKPIETMSLDETIRERPTKVIVAFAATVIEEPTAVGETDMVDVLVKGDEHPILSRALAHKSTQLHAGDHVIVESVEFIQNYTKIPDRPAIARKIPAKK